MFVDSFTERMARKYSYNYDSDTSLDESETEEVIEINGKELNQCEKCNFVGKTEGGLKTHKTKKHTENHDSA